MSTTPRVLDTLIHLVQHRGTLLPRDALMDSIWPDADVEPNNLSQNIVKLRRLFEERPRENRFIETVPGRGYRFIADVLIETAPLGVPSEPGDRPRNDESFQLFLQALRLLQRPTVENCRNAIERLEAALEIDPDFALGWAGLANANLLAANVGLATPVLLEQAERHAEHALGIEPKTAHAHAVIGMVRILRGDWLAAESHLETAVSIDASHPMAPGVHASFLLQQLGYTGRALAQLRAVSALAPDNSLMAMNLATSYCISGRDDEAVRCARLAIGFGYPEAAYPLPLVFIHASTRAHGYTDATPYALQLLNTGRQNQGAAAAVYEALDNPHLRARAVSAIRDLLANLDATIGVSQLMLIVEWLTVLGSLDLAFDVVDRSIAARARTGHGPTHWQTLWLPEMKPFRSDARFRDLTARLRFPDYWNAFGPPDEDF